MSDEIPQSPTQTPSPKQHGNRGRGRPKGSPNKATTDVRLAMAEIAQKGAGKFWKWLEDIKDPAARCNAYLRVLEFNIPKLNRTIFTGGEANEPVRIIVEGIKASGSKT